MELPTDVQALLRAHVESYEALHILLLLFQERRDWSTDEIGARLKLPVPAVGNALTSLARHALAARVEASAPDTHYCYRISLQDASVAALVRVFREHPSAVLRLMAIASIERIRANAPRAFVYFFPLCKAR
ncbi:MAG TPA: hypothetical protein VMF64_05320 [Steroidobacteraceae bacterium]|nr:hypothetical protein [Steroidobacteraceae bacterium]